MDYFWKENKKFVLAVGAGVLVAFFYNMFVLGPLGRSAGRAKDALQKEKGELRARMANGVPSEESLRAARAGRDRSKLTLTALVNDVAFKSPEKFKKPDRETLKAHFENLKLDLYKALHEKAVGSKIAFPPNLGLDDNAADDTAAEYLQRLAIVERLAQLAIDADVEKIELLDGLAGAGSREEGPSKKPPFLSKYGVFMKFSGKAESVFKVLHGVQKKGLYLAVSHFEAIRDDGTKDQFAATISVAMLKVDEKASLETR
jgi:hypothetical protein